MKLLRTISLFILLAFSALAFPVDEQQDLFSKRTPTARQQKATDIKKELEKNRVERFQKIEEAIRGLDLPTPGMYAFYRKWDMHVKGAPHEDLNRLTTEINGEHYALVVGELKKRISSVYPLIFNLINQES